MLAFSDFPAHEFPAHDFPAQAFPAHVQLMLLAARTRLRPEEIAAIEALTRDPAMDWAQFLAVTAHHRVSPLVFEALDRVRPTGLPEAVREQLQARARRNAFEALRATQEARRVAEAFAAAGLELAALKGVALSQFLYGNPNTRHVGDIDLLTQPQRLTEQIALLAGLGYERINPASRLTPNRIAAYVSFWKDFTFRCRGSGFELDLHWRLFNNRFHAANRIPAQARFETITVFGVAMRVFSPADQFVYIAAHGVLDAWTYLKSLADVAAFLRRFTPEELDAALQRAAELGLLGQISGAIHLANAWMGAGVESARLLPTEEPIARRIRERTTAMLLKQNFKPDRSYLSPAEWLRLEMELVPGVRSRAEIARRFAWRPRVWSLVDLPDGLFWVYPVLGLLLLPRHHSAED
jgi:hypothetical protein